LLTKEATVSNVSLTVLNSPPRVYGTLAADSQPIQNQANSFFIGEAQP
jgi:hypothetical protein